MSAPRVSLVVAISRNRVIGAQGALPWHLPEDLKYFKRLTMGHPIIMGRKTFESIGRLLPGRSNVVVTRKPDYRAPGAVVVASLEEALAACRDTDEVFVIGGAEIFRQLLNRAERIYATELLADFEGDVVFPEYDPSRWREVSREKHRDGDLEYHFVVYERKDRGPR